MNWEAVSAAGQILSAVITLIVGVVAFSPYMKKCDIAFSFMRNTSKQPTFYIVNSSQKIRFVRGIELYSGNRGRKFLRIEMFEIEDDLLFRGKKKLFIPPNSYKEYKIDATRLVYQLMHYDYILRKKDKNKRVYAKVDFGFEKSRHIKLQYTTEEFISGLIEYSGAYSNQCSDAFLSSSIEVFKS